MEKEVSKLEKEKSRLEKAGEDVEVQLQSTRELIDYMKEKEGNGLVDIRLKLRDQIRWLIEEIKISPIKKGYRAKYRHFIIRFPEGTFPKRWIVPLHDGPILVTDSDGKGSGEYWEMDRKEEMPNY